MQSFMNKVMRKVKYLQIERLVKQEESRKSLTKEEREVLEQLVIILEEINVTLRSTLIQVQNNTLFY